MASYAKKIPQSRTDVKHQSRDTAAAERANRSLERQNAKLKEDIKGLKKLLRLQKSVTKGRLFDPGSVDTAAKTLMKSVSAKGDRAELREELNRLYDYIATDKEVTWEGVKAQASGAAEWLMQHMEREERLDPYAEEVLRELKGLRVSLNENQIRNGAYAYGGAREFRNAALGKFIISKNATPLDSIWAELAESYPSLFDRDISDADQGTELIRIFERLRSMTAESELDYYDSELLEQELIRQVYDSYWDISTMQTVADTKQEEINQLKAEHRRQMDELKAEHEQKIRQLKEAHKAETAKIRREAEQRYTQKRLELLRQVEDARQRNAANREISNLRRMISREAKQLDGLLNRGGKDRNVKEDMQSFVARALYYHSAIFADNITAEEMIKTRYEENRRMGEYPHRRVEPGRDTPIYEQGNGTFRMRYEDGENRRMIGFGGEESRYTGPLKGDEFEHRQSSKDRGYSHSTVTMPLDRHKAEEWVKHMRNADGTTGPHWTYEQAEKLMRQKGIDCDPVIFWVCMNAEYSDRCKVYKDYGVGSIDFYADCVRAFWLEDEDAVEDKPAAYYACIVRH